MSDHPDEAKKNIPPEQEPVWTFRGYRLRASEFTTAMVHFFRAEISRANVWRQRLDTTTNWAVITTGAAITIAFNPGGHHAVIILNTLLVTLFLYIEARRYRYYELWSYRVRLMETDFYAAMLVPPFQPASDWAESLAENLLHPDFSITMWEALGRRFRRNYLWIYLILGLAWGARVALLPKAAVTWQEFFANAAIGGISGQVVITIGFAYYCFLLMLGVLTSGLHQATGEVLPRYLEDARGVPVFNGLEGARGRPWFRLSKRRRLFVALIITSKAEAVSQKILQEMKRGVTALSGRGMFTGTARQVLLCALTITEVAQMKALVRDIEADAFVIIIPAQEVLGRGFLPLHAEE